MRTGPWEGAAWEKSREEDESPRRDSGTRIQRLHPTHPDLAVCSRSLARFTPLFPLVPFRTASDFSPCLTVPPEVLGRNPLLPFAHHHLSCAQAIPIPKFLGFPGEDRRLPQPHRGAAQARRTRSSPLRLHVPRRAARLPLKLGTFALSLGMNHRRMGGFACVALSRCCFSRLPMPIPCQKADSS